MVINSRRRRRRPTSWEKRKKSEEEIWENGFDYSRSFVNFDSYYFLIFFLPVVHQFTFFFFLK